MKFDTLGWLDEAIEVNCMHKSMSRQGQKVTHLVIHGTAGGTRAEDTGNYFKTSDVDSSSHFVVGRDGHVVQCVSCSVASWANGILLNPRLPFPANVNPNYYTISIEHCKPSTDNSDQLTEPQKQASFRLIKALCEQYNIPKRKGDVIGGIVSHADFDNVNRHDCPGAYPWDEMLKYVKGGTTTMSGVPAGWMDNRNVLSAPSGHTVVLGFRDYILNNTWPADLVPIEQELPDGSGGTFQVFASASASAILTWTKDGVKLGNLAQLYLAAMTTLQAPNPLLAKYANLLKQIAALATITPS